VFGISHGYSDHQCLKRQTLNYRQAEQPPEMRHRLQTWRIQAFLRHKHGDKTPGERLGTLEEDQIQCSDGVFTCAAQDKLHEKKGGLATLNCDEVADNY